MNKELRKIYEELCLVNDKIIEQNSKTGIIPMCFILEEDENDVGKFKASAIAFPFSDYIEKRMAREMLKKLILSKKTKGYILFLDAKITIGDMNNPNEREVKDCVLRSLFTPNMKIKGMCVYDEDTGKIITKDVFIDTEKGIGKDWKAVDEWDLYGEWFDEDDEKVKKIQKEYDDYKEKNPDKYKGII